MKTSQFRRTSNSGHFFQAGVKCRIPRHFILSAMNSTIYRSELFTFYILDNTYILLELSTFYILDNIFNQVGAGLMVHPRLAATGFYSLPLISKTQECCTSRCVRFSTQVLYSVSNTFQKTSVVLTFQHFPKHKCCVLFSTQQHSSLTLYSLPGRVCNACY